MTEEQIHTICNKYKIKNYTINDDMSIDVNGNVDLFNKKLDKLPLKFNKVNGWFNCSGNKLTTLEGCPIKVFGNFYCQNNQLASLKNGPQFIGGVFYCAGNPIYEEFYNKFNSDYNLYLKYTKRQKILKQLVDD